MDENRELWKKAVAFHGHQCGGLTIGYKLSLYAIELLDISFAKDEEIVCIAENNSCSIDAIQVILGCTAGKSNLLFHMTNKQAYSLFNLKNGKSVRLVLRPAPEGMTRAESFAYYQGKEPRELFDIKPVKLALPERKGASGFFVCDCCGELTGADHIRLDGDKKLCTDCYSSFDRFGV
ncbi:MAG: FmdE family protein [Candidatus Limivicinus sp.]|jgi:formylmethanofuran dehydrogenase subunit E